MHLRGQTTTFQTRLEISEHAAAGLHDRQIAALVGCSVWTVRKWRRRVLHQGPVGLISRMGRPARGPLSTFPLEVKAAILHLRQLHADWGPNTLLATLKTDTSVRTHPLPSRAQLARLLKYTGLTCHYQSSHDLPQKPGASLSTSHHLTGLTAETVLKPDGHDFMRLNTSVLPPDYPPPLDTEDGPLGGKEEPSTVNAETPQLSSSSRSSSDEKRKEITTTTKSEGVSDDLDKFLAYEEQQGQAWRTELEIDADRQKFLTRWLPIVPDIKEGQYPFLEGACLLRTNLREAPLVGACLEHACFSDEKERGPPG